jgi:hypothetical protein
LIHPTSDSGEFGDPHLAYDHLESTYAPAEVSSVGIPSVEHLFGFPTLGTRSGSLRARIGIIGVSPGETATVSALYSTDGGETFNELGSTPDGPPPPDPFTVALSNVDLGLLRVKLRGESTTPGGELAVLAPVAFVGAYEIDFTELPPPGCECATDVECDDQLFCTEDSCSASLCQNQPVCAPSEFCDEANEVCIAACPTKTLCGGTGCRSAAPPSCTVSNTNVISCADNGQLLTCPVGQTIHIQTCPCQVIIPGTPCANTAKNWFCI